MRGKKITKQKPGTAHLQPSKWQTPSSLGRHLPTRTGLCPPGDPAAPLARPRTAPPGPPPARGLSPRRAQRGAVPPHLPPARGSARDAGAQPNGGRPAPGGSKPLRAKPPLRPRSLTVRPSHDVLQERVLRRHQPSPSPGHSRSAGARRRGFAQGLAEPRSAAPLPARSARLMPPPGPWHGCAASALPPPPAHRSPAVAAAPPPDLPAAPPAGRRSAAPPRHKAGAAAPPSGSGLPNSADDCSAARRKKRRPSWGSALQGWRPRRVRASRAECLKAPLKLRAAGGTSASRTSAWVPPGTPRGALPSEHVAQPLSRLPALVSPLPRTLSTPV